MTSKPNNQAELGEKNKLEDQVEQWAQSKEGTAKLLATAKTAKEAADFAKKRSAIEYDRLRKPVTL